MHRRDVRSYRPVHWPTINLNFRTSVARFIGRTNPTIRPAKAAAIVGRYDMECKQVLPLEVNRHFDFEDDRLGDFDLGLQLPLVPGFLPGVGS